jgi:sulfite reductase alpha subunit-like flavoprotein
MLNDKLIQFSSDFTEYKSYIKDSRRNLREVLEDFPLLHLSLEYLLEHINLLRFREYSIASAFNGSTVRLLVRLVEKELTPYRTIKGLLSNEITQ